MNKLEESRLKIDQIDSEIISLFIKRMEVVKEVTAYKKENNLPVLDSSREQAMLEKHLTKLGDSEYKEFYHFVLEGFLSASKEMQKKLLEK